MSDAFPNPGDLFEGRYVVGPLIGSGGFARVYKARDDELGREVALKILIPSKDATEGDQYSGNLVERFNQEARLVSRLRDPHTITMFDYGRAPNGLLYMVFEFINGDSLSTLIHTQGALSPKRAVKILKQVFSSLEEAHAMGVLHRDLKPGNIMVFEHVGRRDQAKLLDFGIAKLTSSTKTMKGDLTADGALIGTPRYMSPEQIRGQQMTPQSDIYSIGLVAYEMLMGRKAIESNSSVTIIGQQLDPTPFYVPQTQNLPEGLRSIINRMLAKDIDVRFKTAREVLDSLEAWERNPDHSDWNLVELDDSVDTAVLTSEMGLPDISDEVLPLVEETPSSDSLSRELAASELDLSALNTQMRSPQPVMEHAPASPLYPPGTATPQHKSYPPGTLNAPTHQSYPPGTLTPAHQSYPPGTLHPPSGAYPAVQDQSVILVPQGPNKTAMALGGVIVVLLCTLVGFVVYNATKADSQPVVEPVAEKAEEPPKEPVEEAAPVAQLPPIIVSSNPSGADVSVGGRPMGTTPMQIASADQKYPLRVRVSKDGVSELVTLNKHQAKLNVQLSMPEPDEKEVASNEPKEEPKVEEPKVAAKKPVVKKTTRAKKTKTKTTSPKRNVIASSDEKKDTPKKEEPKKSSSGITTFSVEAE